MPCKYCRQPSDGEVCAACRGRAGLDHGGEPRRPLRPCTRCGHTELVHALAREFTVLQAEAGVRHDAAPMAVTALPTRTESWRGEKGAIEGANPNHYRGTLELYVCLGCGLTEWYCRDPDRIPIGEEYGTEKIVVGAGDGPYR
ncbi:MAG: hypothetical protein JNL83_24910 [Myxococcales bacterium]|nr:hypothetical protein [Myxococcales bacterium]